MAVSTPGPFGTILATSVTLCERFAESLAPDAVVELPPTNTEAPSPLVLLNAATVALKAQVTKLSLLAITTPFTPSAVSKCLVPLNESTLTSLVSAALLTTPKETTASFAAECRSLAAITLRDMRVLLLLLEKRSQAKDLTTELSDPEKKSFTEVTGRVWDDCEKLVLLAKEGVPGYVARKSKQWLDLMKDAVKELEEWDPEDDIDDEDLFGDSHSDVDGEGDPSEKAQDGAARAAISAGVKEQALKVLHRIPQSIHVVIKQRLDKVSHSEPVGSSILAQLDGVLQRTRQISELIDESAESMYLGNLELSLKKAGEARAVTIEVVESVVPGFPLAMIAGAPTPTKEDQYIQRALEWIRQVEPGSVQSRTKT